MRDSLKRVLCRDEMRRRTDEPLALPNTTAGEGVVYS